MSPLLFFPDKRTPPLSPPQKHYCFTKLESCASSSISRKQKHAAAEENEQLFVNCFFLLLHVRPSLQSVPWVFESWMRWCWRGGVVCVGGSRSQHRRPTQRSHYHAHTLLLSHALSLSYITNCVQWNPFMSSAHHHTTSYCNNIACITQSQCRC